jgi:DMSO reductase family type II enzyme chaperone
MTKSSQVYAAQANPADRSTIYKLLSLAFGYPTEDLIHAFQNGEYMNELLAALSAIPHLQSLAAEWDQSSEKSREQLNGVSSADFEVNFIRTFDVGTSTPPCPPYEGFYRQEKGQTTIMLEVSEFYKHFGLAMDQDDGKRELPDHLCAELEFLHFLAFKEAQARNKETEELLKGYLMAQRDFLQRHPAGWVPAFYQKLKESAVMPFYVQLAKITSDIIRYDLEWLEAELEDSLTAVG